MPVTGVSQTNRRVTGFELFQGLEDSGQLNFYEAVRSSLDPFYLVIESDPNVYTLAFLVTYFAQIKVQTPNFATLSKKQGYPDRYDFGQFRWLSGAAACENNFVDCFNWIEPVKRSIWVVKSSYPDRTFPASSSTELFVADFIFPICGGFINGFDNVPNYQAAEQFAWDFKAGNIFDVCIFWNASEARFGIEFGAPDPQIFWYYV